MAKKQFQWVRDGEDDDGEELSSGRRDSSRSQRKREADRLDALVRELLRLQPAQWQGMPLSDQLLAGLVEGRRLQQKTGVRGGLRRHVLHIAGLLRREDDDTVAAIEAAAEERGGPSDRELALMAVERWRERILRDGDRALDEFIAEHPQADRQRLRQLAMAARRAVKDERRPRAFRQLFAYLREVIGV